MTTVTRDRVEDLKRTLPGRYYFDPAVHALEAERIFERTWVNAGHRSRIAEPGDFFTLTLGSQAVFVVRGLDGVARAFLNSCRHRGTTVCEAAHGNAGTSFQCPYHLWTYRLDGTLSGAPMSDTIDGFDKSDFGLRPVRLEEWQGYLWLNADPDAGDVASHAWPQVEDRMGERARFEAYGIDDLVCTNTIEYDVAANWKLVVENFMECYHCSPVHPGLVEIIPEFKTGVTQVPLQGTDFAPGLDAFTWTGRTNRPKLPGLRDEHLHQYFGMVIRPNTFVNLTPDHVSIHRVMPVDATHSHVTCDWLFHPDAVNAPDFDPEDAVGFFDAVNREDWVICERQQPGVASRQYADGGYFFPTEGHIRDFCDWVLEHLEG